MSTVDVMEPSSKIYSSQKQVQFYINLLFQKVFFVVCIQKKKIGRLKFIGSKYVKIIPC